MATELNFNTQDEDEQDGPETLLGSSGGAAAASSPMGAAPGTQRQVNPSGRPNIKQYMQANQDAGNRLAGGIQNKTQNEASKLNTSINQNRNQLNTSANPLQQNLGEAGSQKIQSAFKDPSAILAQQDQLGQFKKLQNQGYNTDINAIQQNVAGAQNTLQSQVGNLANKATQAGTEEGRFELLRNSFSQPTYNRGQQKLDQLFLQAQPGVNKGLQQNLNNVATQAGQGVGAFSAEAQSKLQALQGLSQQRADEIQNLVKGGTSEGLEDDLNSRGLDDIGASSQAQIAAAQAKLGANAGLQSRLASNTLTAEDLAQLGLTEGQELWDASPTNYFQASTMDPNSVNAASVADPNEVARYRALQQLSGDTSADIFGGAQEFGTFNPYQWDKEALNAQAGKSKQYWEGEALQNVVKKMTTPTGGYSTFTAAPGSWGDILTRGVAAAKTPDQLRSAIEAARKKSNSMGGTQLNTNDFMKYYAPQAAEYLTNYDAAKGKKIKKA